MRYLILSILLLAVCSVAFAQLPSVEDRTYWKLVYLKAYTFDGEIEWYCIYVHYVSSIVGFVAVEDWDGVRYYVFGGE